MSNNGSAAEVELAGRPGSACQRRHVSEPSTAAAHTSAPSRTTPSTIAPVPRPSTALPHRCQPTGTRPSCCRTARSKAGRRFPWSQVGQGWYLAAPHNATSDASKGLYLINPIGGRYLITDQLPNTKDGIAKWSPDDTRVMLSREPKGTCLRHHRAGAGNRPGAAHLRRRRVHVVHRLHQASGRPSWCLTSTARCRRCKRLRHRRQPPADLSGRCPAWGRWRPTGGSIYTADGSELLVGAANGHSAARAMTVT